MSLFFIFFFVFFFFKQNTAYVMRISDWSSDVCSSDLRQLPGGWRISLFSIERTSREHDRVQAIWRAACLHAHRSVRRPHIDACPPDRVGTRLFPQLRCSCTQEPVSGNHG